MSSGGSVKLKCSIPVIDVPYDALQKELGKSASCQKVTVQNGNAISGYEKEHERWSDLLQKLNKPTRCAVTKTPAGKLDKTEEDKRRFKDAVLKIASCLHLQAIPDGNTGKGMIYNPFSQEAVMYASDPSHPDLRPLFDTRKCMAQCGAIKRSTSRSTSRSASRSRSAKRTKTSSGGRTRSRSSSRGSARMKRRSGGSRMSSSRFGSYSACASLVPLGGDAFRKLLHAEQCRPVPIVREDVVFLLRGGEATEEAKFLELGPMGRAASLLLGLKPDEVYDETKVAAVCKAVFKCGPCPVKSTAPATKAGLVSFAETDARTKRATAGTGPYPAAKSALIENVAQESEDVRRNAILDGAILAIEALTNAEKDDMASVLQLVKSNPSSNDYLPSWSALSDEAKGVIDNVLQTTIDNYPTAPSVGGRRVHYNRRSFRV